MNKARKYFGRFSPSITARILLAMLLGGLAGALLGPRVSGIGEIGKILITLIKALATPLLLFAILDTFLRARIKARSGAIMVAISAINGTLAVLIGLTIVNIVRPGDYLRSSGFAESSSAKPPEVRPIRFVEDFLGMIPTNLVDPFRTNAILPVIGLAVLGGLALRRFKDEQIAEGKQGHREFENLVAGGFRAIELILGWVVALLPLAVFAVIAQTVGTQGFASIRALGVYFVVVLLGLAVQVGVVYQAWVLLASRMPLRRFWAGVRAPVAFSAGCNSSLATVPVTLKSLTEMGVSDESSRMAACVGTNLNNDGVLLYEAMAAIFVAQCYGIDLSLGQQLAIAATCVLATVGIAGVPEAGMISLAMVLTTAGLPLEILPLLLSVDWILGRCRAMTNVVSDMLLAVLLDRFGGVPADEPATADAPEGIFPEASPVGSF